MAKPLLLPNATEQAVLDGLIVRLITPSEQAHWDQLITQLHYLRDAHLVGEQPRYVAEFGRPVAAVAGLECSGLVSADQPSAPGLVELRASAPA